MAADAGCHTDLGLAGAGPARTPQSTCSTPASGLLKYEDAPARDSLIVQVPPTGSRGGVCAPGRSTSRRSRAASPTPSRRAELRLGAHEVTAIPDGGRGVLRRAHCVGRHSRPAIGAGTASTTSILRTPSRRSSRRQESNRSKCYGVALTGKGGYDYPQLPDDRARLRSLL